MEDLIVTLRNSSFLPTEETLPCAKNLDYPSNDNISKLSLSTYPTLGPQRDPLYIVVPITVIYLSILITGAIGNISTCIVIARNKSMHTATNYYLFSLAISDLLLLIFGLPVEMYLVWFKYTYVFGEIFCIIRGMAAECSTNASVLTITAFTIERYFAICHPFLSRTMSKLSRAIKLILVIWIVALLFAIPMALQFGVVKHTFNPDISMCTFKITIYEHSFEIATFLFFIVPMILITVLYIMIGIKLRQSNMMKQESRRYRSTGNSTHVTNNVGEQFRRSCRHSTGRSTRRVIKMLVAVVVAFFICWAPFHVQRLIYIYGTADDHVSSKSKWMEFFYILVTYISGVLYYVSATINPILYNIMSNKFREAFMETLGRNCCRRGSFSVHQEPRSYSSLSRTQQRSVGCLGSRASGPGGGRGGELNAQESIEYSGNSVRDDDILGRNLPGEDRAGLPLNLDRNNDSVERRIRSNSLSKSRRKKNTDRLIGMNVVEGETRENVSRAVRSNITREWQEGSCRVARNNRINTRIVNQSIDNNQRHNQFNVGTIGETPRKKWWRFFKWLPGVKDFKFNSRTTRYVTPSNSIINEVDSHLEEYSMTLCHISSDGIQRPV